MGTVKNVWTKIRLAYVRSDPEVSAAQLAERFPGITRRQISRRITGEGWGKAREAHREKRGAVVTETIAQLDAEEAIDWIARQREAKQRHALHLQWAEASAAAAFQPNADGKVKKLSHMDRTMAMSALARAIAAEEAVLGWDVAKPGAQPVKEALTPERRERIGRVLALLKAPTKEPESGA